MSHYNIENLKLLRTALIDNREVVEPRLDMTGFISSAEYDRPYNANGQIDECGTTMCVLGWAAAFQVGDIRPDWFDYSRSFVRGYNTNDHSYITVRCWDFLFSSAWYSDFDDAIQRIDYAIEHGTCPDEDEFPRDGIWKC